MSPETMISGWFYTKAGASAGHEVGPLSWSQLYILAREGKLSPDDLVWNAKLPQGVTARQIPELFPESTPAQTPPVVAAAPLTVAVPHPASLPQTLPSWPLDPWTAPGQPFAGPAYAESNPEPPVPYTPSFAALDTDQLQARPKRPRSQEAEKRRDNLPWLVVVLALVIAAAGLTAYFLYFRDTGDSPGAVRPAETTTVDTAHI